MKRLLLIALCLMAIFSSMFIIAEHLGYTDETYVRAQLSALQARPQGNWIVAGVIVGLLAVDLLLPVPSSFVMAFSGYAFGLWAGAGVAFAGSMLAAGIGFYLCRWGGQRVFQRLIGAEDIRAIDAWFEEWGVAGIILSRPVPMLTEILSCLAGLSDLPAKTFFLASAVGHLPICLIYAYSGAASSFDNPWPAAVVALLVPAVGWVVTVHIKRSRRRREGVQIHVVETPGAVEVVSRLAREIWTEHYTPLIGAAQVEYMVEAFQSAAAVQTQIDDGVAYVLAYDGAVPVGYAALRTDGTGDDVGAAFLSKLYVRKAARGSGYGRALLAYAETEARNAGCRRLWLTVNKGNDGSIAAYKWMGFVIAGDYAQDIGDGFVMDDYRMEKAL